MNVRCGTFNVLADEYLGYGDYSQVDPALLLHGGRLPAIIRLINALPIDLLGLQEAEKPLVDALQDHQWQTFWSPKGRDKADGCLTIARPNIAIDNFETHHYKDSSGNVMQSVRIGQTVFANTHIKWAPREDPNHMGVSQTKELLTILGSNPSVILADCNDRPGGPVRELIRNAGFDSIEEDEPTAIANGEYVSLDIIAYRGVKAMHIRTRLDVHSIPNDECPSDHKPKLATVSL